MKQLSLLLSLLLALTALSALADGSSGVWKLDYYVDEFRMPTDEAYVCNAAPFEGIFSNSAATDAKLSVTLLLDEKGVAFVLYEYGTHQVKNIRQQTRRYNVILRDAAGSKTNLGGFMFAGGDRLLFDEKDAQTILTALKKNPSVSFYIEDEETPMTNYLFTIADTSGFASVEGKLRGGFNERDYQDAVALYNAGWYEEALAAFAALGNYKDSAEWDGKYRAMMYGQAETLLAAGEYEAANQAFIDAANYKDAKARVGEPYYTQAEALLASGEYEAANQAFINAGKYKDAKARVGEPYYTQAETLLAAGEYEAASQAFINAGNYSDAAQRVSEPYYAQGEALLAAGDEDGAIEAFKQAKDYSDAAERCLMIHYSQAEALLAAGDYEAASKAFVKAGSYSDAAQRVDEPYYAQGEALLAAGDEDGAIEAFKQAGDYSDAQERYQALYYQQAEALLAAGDYAAANVAFTNAGDYGDAQDRVGEPYYAQAEALLAEGEYAAADVAFARAGSYRDAAQRIGEASYNMAEEYYRKGDVAHAAICYGKAGRHRDAQARSFALWDSMRMTHSIAAAGSVVAAVKKDGSVLVHESGTVKYYKAADGWKDIVNIVFLNSAMTAQDSGGAIKVCDPSAENQRVPHEMTRWEDIIGLYRGKHFRIGIRSDHTAIFSDGYEMSEGNEDIVEALETNDWFFVLRTDGTATAVYTKTGESAVWEDIIAIDMLEDLHGAATFVCVRADGSVLIDGTTEGDGYKYDASTWTDIVAVSMAYNHIVGLRKDGTVVATGSAKDGKCDVSGWKNIVEVVASTSNTFGLRSDGTMVVVGSNENGAHACGKWSGIRLPEHSPFVKAAPGSDFVIRPTLQKGSVGEDVKRLQRALIDGGYLSGRADGDFGGGTEAAVKSAQEALGLETTGIADDAFQRVLYGE